MHKCISECRSRMTFKEMSAGVHIYRIVLLYYFTVIILLPTLVETRDKQTAVYILKKIFEYTIDPFYVQTF